MPALGLAALVLAGYVGTHRMPFAPDTSGSQAPLELPRLDGDRAPGPAGVRLLVGGTYPRVVDAETGRSSALPGVGPGPGRRVALRPVPGGLVATLTGEGLAGSRVTLLPTAGAPVPLPDDAHVVPAHRGGGVWVATRGGAGTTVEATALTGAAGTRWTSPYRLTLLVDTAAGLVAASTGHAAGAELLLLDPATGRPRRTLAATAIPIATTATSVAWTAAGCAQNCVLTVTEVRTGADEEYLISDSTPSAGAFSPDGRWLALAMPGQWKDGRLWTNPGYAQVINLETGGVYAVPGVATAAERRPDVSWAGDELVLGVWSATTDGIALWSPERSGRLRILPTAPPADPYGSVTVLP